MDRSTPAMLMAFVSFAAALDYATSGREIAAHDDEVWYESHGHQFVVLYQDGRPVRVQTVGQQRAVWRADDA